MFQVEIIPPAVAEKLCRTLTADAPQYFGTSEWNEQHAAGVKTHTNFAIKTDGNYICLLSLGFPAATNANIYWLGILKSYHGKGAGKVMVKAACDYAFSKGAQIIMVDSFPPNENEEEFLEIYNFYKACGFVPLLKPYGKTIMRMAKTLGKVN